MRTASLATWSACRRSIAPSVVPPRGRGSVANRPLVADRRAGDEAIARAADGGDDAGAPVAADRIGSERDAGRDRRDHPLDQHRHASVGGGLIPGDPRGVAAGQDPVGRGDDVLGADAEHRLEHAGIRPFGAILGDAARANRKRPLAEALHRRGDLPIALVRWHLDPFNRQHDAVGNSDVRGHQLSEAGGLASDLGGIGHSHLAQRSSGMHGHRAFSLRVAAIAAFRNQSMSSTTSSTEDPR